jgi:hypothetical protein
MLMINVFLSALKSVPLTYQGLDTPKAVSNSFDSLTIHRIRLGLLILPGTHSKFKGGTKVRTRCRIAGAM